MNEKILITYTSKHGSTQKYAGWIADALGAGICPASKVKPDMLSQYDIVVHGGGLYAGGVAGLKRITENNLCKNLVVFTVGLADPASTDYSDIIKRNLSQELLAKTKIFHLRGGIDYTQLGPVHKIMMAMMRRMILKKPESERKDDDAEFLENYNKKVNFEDKQTIDPILSYVKNLQQ